MPSELHEKLCAKAVAWLKRNGFPVSDKNVSGAGCRERVDAIGFRQQCAVLVEVKVSRADFMADRRKPERAEGGVGTYRFYLAPEGLLQVEELPAGWGLLEYKGRSITMRHGPLGNWWPNFHAAQDNEWREFAHRPCEKSEHALLYALARKNIS